MKRFFKWVAWIFGILVLIAVILIAVGSMYIDTGITTALNKIDGKIPGLHFENNFTDSSFNGQSGILYWQYELPANNPLGERSVEGALRYKVSIGLFSVNVEFNKQGGYGNLDRILESFGLNALSYHGNAAVSLLNLAAKGEMKTDPLEIPLADGRCKVGENILSFSVGANKSIKTGFLASGFDCIGRDLYSGRPSYDIRLDSFSISANPQIKDDRKISLNELTFALKKFDGSLSSIYLIGFGPEESVRDRSLRESVKVEDVKIRVGLSGSDLKDRRKVDFAGSGDIYLAFPHVKDNKVLPYYDLKDLRLTTSLGYVDIDRLIKAVKGKDDDLLSKIMVSFSDNVTVKLDNFSVNHGGEEIKASGEASLLLDKKAMKPGNATVVMKFAAGRNFVESLLEDQYKETFDTLLKNGSVRFDGSSYSTLFELRNNGISLNGIPMGGTE